MVTKNGVGAALFDESFDSSHDTFTGSLVGRQVATECPQRSAPSGVSTAECPLRSVGCARLQCLAISKLGFSSFEIELDVGSECRRDKLRATSYTKFPKESLPVGVHRCFRKAQVSRY